MNVKRGRPWMTEARATNQAPVRVCKATFTICKTIGRWHFAGSMRLREKEKGRRGRSWRSATQHSEVFVSYLACFLLVQFAIALKKKVKSAPVRFSPVCCNVEGKLSVEMDDIAVEA